MSKTFWVGVACMAWSMLWFVSLLCFPGVYFAEPLIQEIVLLSALTAPLVASICFFTTKGVFIKIIAVVCFLFFAGSAGVVGLLMSIDGSLWEALETGQSPFESELARVQVGDAVVIASQAKESLIYASTADANRTVFIKAEKKVPPLFKSVKQIGRDNDFKVGTPSDTLLVAIDSNHVKWRDQVFEIK